LARVPISWLAASTLRKEAFAGAGSPSVPVAAYDSAGRFNFRKSETVETVKSSASAASPSL
jgi:hypothetical protein